MASAAEDSRTRFLPSQRGTPYYSAAATASLYHSSMAEKGFDNVVLREEETAFFLLFGRI